MLQEVRAGDVREDGRHIVKRFHTGVEVSDAVVPHAVTVVTRAGCARRPKFVVILQHGAYLIDVGSLVVEHIGRLKENAHVLLPEVAVVEVVLLRAKVRLVAVAGDFHQHLFRGGALVIGQTVIKQVVDADVGQGYVGGNEVRSE